MRIQRCSKEPPAAEDTHHARRKSEVKEEGQRKETKPIINLLYKQKERERERERLLCTNNIISIPKLPIPYGTVSQKKKR